MTDVIGDVAASDVVGGIAASTVASDEADVVAVSE